MPRANRKNQHHNNKKKKNARRSEGQTSTASVVDLSVEVPRGDSAQNAAANFDVGSSLKIPLESRGGESKNSKSRRDKGHGAPTGNGWEDGNASANDSSEKEKEKIIENKLNIEATDLKGEPNMDLQHDKETFDGHAEDDTTTSITGPPTIQREQKTWTAFFL